VGLEACPRELAFISRKERGEPVAVYFSSANKENDSENNLGDYEKRKQKNKGKKRFLPARHRTGIGRLCGFWFAGSIPGRISVLNLLQQRTSGGD
jgi:hypothetical protein